MTYPPKHHPIFMIQAALEQRGVPTAFHRDAVSRGMWALELGGHLFVWLIDMRWQHERDAHEADVRKLIADGAFVCSAQKPDAEYFGCAWLPLAVTPGYDKPAAPVEKIMDVAFVGYVRDRQRSDLLLNLNRDFTLMIGQDVFGERAVEIYHEARVAVNIPTAYGNPRCYDVNMRVFEVMATGTPLITNNLPTLETLFGADAVMVYDDPDGLTRAVRTLIDDADLRTALADRAYAVVMEGHTYDKRAEQVINFLKLTGEADANT